MDLSDDTREDNPYKPAALRSPGSDGAPVESPLEKAARSLFVQLVAALILLGLLFFPLWRG